LEETITHTEGVDIVLALDASGTMAAEDFEINGKRVNRLAVVKNVVDDFINRRQADRIGIVAFAGRAYTLSPLTTDHSWLKANLDRLELGLIEDGTAIGSALASAVSRLEKSKAKSRIIILLTDGMNNAGKINPVAAASAAKALGLRVYTIGAGTNGYVPFPVQDPWGRRFYQKARIDIDENLLKEIARITDAKYYRAVDTAALQRIYKEIDALEKTRIEQKHFQSYKEFFPMVLGAGLAVLGLEIILSNSLFLKVP